MSLLFGVIIQKGKKLDILNTNNMDLSVSWLCVAVLTFICVKNIIYPFLHKNRYEIWSPITFISLTFLYYCVFPNFEDITNYYGHQLSDKKWLFNLCALVSYLIICYTFKKSNNKSNYVKWNSLWSENNTLFYALALFMFAIVCYVPVQGITLSIASNGAIATYNSEGFDSYLREMIALFAASSCIMVTSNSKESRLITIIILWISLVTFVVSGFRYRIVILIISVATSYYLSHQEKRINVPLLLVIATVVYFGFNIMDQARVYGSGLDFDIIRGMNSTDIQQKAGETEHIYGYSILVLDKYNDVSKWLFFSPLLTAMCMFLPRAIFPWKPDAQYLADTHILATGSIEDGSVYLNFVEAFMSFGWIGLVINAMAIGWLAKRFWSNYLNNPNTIGSIVALALFNGFCYVIVSRGYLAQQFSTFVYFVCIPFWLTGIIKRFCKK